MTSMFCEHGIIRASEYLVKFEVVPAWCVVKDKTKVVEVRVISCDFVDRAFVLSEQTDTLIELTNYQVGAPGDAQTIVVTCSCLPVPSL